jgi:hypothetical protein
MNGEQPDFYKWMQDLTARSVADQTRALQRYNELMQRVLRGELNNPQLRDEYARFAREEATRYTSDLVQLSLRYYGALLELGRNYSDRFFDQMVPGREPKAPPDNTHEAPAKPRQVPLELQGAAGQAAAAGFVIENKRNTPAEISFLVSEFVDSAGGAPFRAPLEIQPAQFYLDPQAEAEVTLRLPLLRELFEPGHHYRATVVVRGYDELELVLSVHLSRGDEAAAPVSPPYASQPAGKAAEPLAPAKRSRGASTRAKPGRGKKPVNSRPRRNGPGAPSA